MILYMEDPKDVTRTPLELIDEFGYVADYKLNTKKSVALLSTNSKITEREIQEIIQFTVTSKKNKIKYLGINLPKETRDFYTENYKMLIKETKEDTNTWKDIQCLWIRSINIIKMIIPLNTFYRFNAIFIKLPTAFFFTELEQQQQQIS